jgi:Fe-S cluster assembly protein SufD
MALTFKENNQLYLSNFKTFEKNLNGEAKSWLHTVRREALEKFDDLGFPTTRHEEWKYTNITPIAKENFRQVLEPDFSLVKNEDIGKYDYNGLDAHLLVFVDGHFAKQFSSVQDLPHGVKIGSLADALRTDAVPVKQHLAKYAPYEDDSFTALNTAFIVDGAYIYLAENALVEKPIHMLFVSSNRNEPFITHPRNLIVAGKHSKAAIIETYAGVENNRYFTNTVTEIVVDENAFLDHLKIQEESNAAFHVSTTQVYQKANSNFVSNSITFGGLIVRNNPRAILDAEGVESTLNGLYLGTGQQLIDNHTTIDHAKPHCNSHELYKGVLDGAARGVFNGKIFVRLDAQKTDAKQTNQALLLSDDASIDTKPQLEIFADDVKCTHGATVGQLDDDALFYLRTRGIHKDLARDILTYAFASDVIDRITIKKLRDYCHHRVLVKLQADRLEGIDQE